MGSEPTVRRYVRFAKLALGIDTPCAFIPCDPEAGHEGEADWGTAKAILAGEAVRLKFFCMRSKYSGKHFVRFYICDRQQAPQSLWIRTDIPFRAVMRGFE